MTDARRESEVQAGPRDAIRIVESAPITTGAVDCRRQRDRTIRNLIK